MDRFNESVQEQQWNSSNRLLDSKLNEQIDQISQTTEI